MNAKEFQQLVKDMRARQREYFKTKAMDALQAAKVAEARLDAEIDRVVAIVKRTGTPSEPNQEYKFFTIVILMRDAQKEYFKTKDKGIMEMAKGFEKEVDTYITRKEDPQQELFK